MNFLIRGLVDLRFAALIGIPLYTGILLFLHACNIRKGIDWKCVPELLFCIYGVFLVKTVGLFSLSLGFESFRSYQLIPLIGSSFIPVFLNFLLFVPFGFLLPIAFPSRRWNWKADLAGRRAHLLYH